MRSLVLLLVLVCACGGEEAAFFDAGSAPTYFDDVAPIFAEHCNGCHSAGNIAPIALDDVKQAQSVASAIKRETQSRTMPPFIIDGRGDCQSFRDDASLSDEQIAIIAAWADAGAPAGEPKAIAAAPALPTLEAPDVLLDPGVAYAPRPNVDDDYRCFIVDPGLQADAFLTAYEVRPDVLAQVHHVVLYTVDSAEEQAAAEALDAAEEGPGYSCFGGAGTGGGRSIAVWAPGTGATRYPAGTGIRLHGGRPLVMQLHYNGGLEPDRTTIALETVDTVQAEGVMTGVFDVSLSLPPGMEGVTESAALPLPRLDVPVTLHGVYPHMHRYGRAMRAYWDKDGASTCLADVPRYDFDWQRFFFYEEGVTLPPPGGGHFRIECTYDTRGADRELHWGEGTDDEMCIAAFYATYPVGP